jgi:2-C-methyl-D-erythritol 4-phosphate cytidylyltransferase
MQQSTECRVIIPAAGSGSRMQSEVPKQYLLLAGKPVLQHTLDALLQHPAMRRVLLVLAPDDSHFDRFDWSTYAKSLVVARIGGDSRAASVRNGLRYLQPHTADSDWVLVHDAARPCLGQAELQRLFAELQPHPVGGILAVPVADTLKRADSAQHVEATVSRAHLWQAQTPQMFRYGLLLRALQNAADESVTDEASAVEQLGLRPALVMGSARNIKITLPGDLPFAEWILQQKEMR